MEQRVSLVALGVDDLGRAGTRVSRTPEAGEGLTLAHNVRSPAEVDGVLGDAEAAGASIARPGAETFWGGYSGVFVDPDGHAWEIAHNPRGTLRDDGSISLPR